LHPIWDETQPLYNTDDVVLYEDNIYIAASSEGCEADDIPGKSVHWLHVCSCPLEPTPTPTPTPEITPTPTPTPVEDCPPTPTPSDMGCVCSNYPVWSGVKYDSFALVSWNGAVWEAYEWEGTDENDEPGKSIHWKHICDCEPTPTPTPDVTPTPSKIECCSDESVQFKVGNDVETYVDVSSGLTLNKFVYTGSICIPPATLDYCSNVITPVTIKSPENKNIGTIIFYGGVNNESVIYLSIDESKFAEQYGYENYNTECLYGHIRDGVCKLIKIK
jgi:hypothetical protein